MFLLYCILFFNFFSCNAIQNVTQTTIVNNQLSTTPTDISFLSADIKISKNEFKFCEIEDAVYNAIRKAQFKPTGQKDTSHFFYLPDWQSFFSFLQSFNVPIWYVGYKPNNKNFNDKTLVHTGIKYCKNLQELNKDYCFKCLISQKQSTYGGIIIYREVKQSNHRDSLTYHQFKLHYPQFLYVNNIARNFVTNKEILYSLFNYATLEHFLPTFGVYSKKYSTTLIHQILREIASEYLIIKPLNAIKSDGIIMISRNNLDQTLKQILLHHTNKQYIPSFDYWTNNHDNSFIVMEYAPSTTLTYKNKYFDPTLRISFILYHTDNKIIIYLLRCFWRIPPQDLASSSSLTEQHISTPRIVDESLSGIFVDLKDIIFINEALPPILAQLYASMLKLGNIPYPWKLP